MPDGANVNIIHQAAGQQCSNNMAILLLLATRNFQDKWQEEDQLNRNLHPSPSNEYAAADVKYKLLYQVADHPQVRVMPRAQPKS